MCGPRRDPTNGRRATDPGFPAGRVSPDLLAALCVAALAFLLYAPSLHYDFTNWDDPGYVIDNPWIRGFAWASVKRWWSDAYFGNYAPLTLASYALDHTFWRLRPAGYHLTNVLLHATSAGLLLLALRRCGATLAAAVLGAILFAIHPAQVESVAWVAQRKTLVAGFFLLASFLAYTRATRDSSPSMVRLTTSFVLYLAAILSKPTAAMLPAALFLYDLGRRRERWPRLLLEKWPFFIAACAIVILTRHAQMTTPGLAEARLTGNFAAYVGLSLEAIGRYARILLFPTNLTPLYEVPSAPVLTDPRALAGFAFVAVGIWGFLWAARRARGLLVWMGFFWLSLLQVLPVVTHPIFLAQRYLHIPLLGFAASAGIGADALARRITGRQGRALLAVLLAAVVIFLAALTLSGERVWRDSISLWSAAVARPPVRWTAYSNYGAALEAAGDMSGAILQYERALDHNPDAILAITNLGNAYARVGELERAEALLRRAADLPGGVPAKRAQAAVNLGVVLEARGRRDAALSAYQKALALDPESVDARVNLAKCLRALGRATAARLRFEQVLERDPGNVAAEIGLADLDADAGRHVAARRRLDALIARIPKLPEALLERARVYAKEGNTAAARADLDRALDLAPPGALRREIVESRDALTEPAAPR